MHAFGEQRGKINFPLYFEWLVYGSRYLRCKFFLTSLEGDNYTTRRSSQISPDLCKEV